MVGATEDPVVADRGFERLLPSPQARASPTGSAQRGRRALMLEIHNPQTRIA